MNRWLAAFATFVLMLLVAHPRAAFATEYVDRYEIDVTPRDDGRAAFRVLIEYGGAEAKLSGFKYFGTHEVERLRVTDEKGHALPHKNLRDTREYKVEFDLAHAATPHKTVVLSFEQDLDLDGTTSGDVASLPWAPNFRIPVTKMIVRAHGAVVEGGEGFSCKGQGASRVCTRASDGLLPSVELRLRDTGLAGRWVAVAIAAFLASFAAIAIVAYRRRRLTETKGVIPPVTEVAYPEQATGYREAPVLPRGGTAVPTLPPEEVKAFRKRVIGAALWCFLPCVFALAFHFSFVRRESVFATVLVLSTLPFAYLVLREKPGPLVFAMWAGFLMATFAFGAFGICFSIVPLGFFHLLTLIKWPDFSKLGTGGSSWSSGGSSWSSSSSSSSSCGGGGGSSCGGGGGGGCGGGGGGGGCGG